MILDYNMQVIEKSQFHFHYEELAIIINNKIKAT